MNRPIYIRMSAVVYKIGTFIKIVNAWFKISTILLNIATNRQMLIYFHLNRIEYQNFWYMNRPIYIRMSAVVSNISTFIKIVKAWFKIGTILLKIATNRQMTIFFIWPVLHIFLKHVWSNEGNSFLREMISKLDVLT